MAPKVEGGADDDEEDEEDEEDEDEDDASGHVRMAYHRASIRARISHIQAHIDVLSYADVRTRGPVGFRRIRTY